MEITTQMLADIKKEHATLEKEYKDIRFREELYRVAIGLAKHTVSVIYIKERTLEQVYYEAHWTGVTSKMRNAPESVIETGVVHKDSVETYRQMFKEVYAGNPEGKCTLRIKDEKEGWMWFQVYYKTLYDDKKQPVRAICYSENISQKREAEIMFKQFVKIVEAKSDYVYQINLTQDQLVDVIEDRKNNTGVQAGITYSELNSTVIKCVLPKYQQQVNDLFNRTSMLQKFYNGQRELSAQYEYQWEEGTEPIWLESTIFLLMNTDNEVCGILSTRNISTEKNRKKASEQQARYDQLCPVLKRDAFETSMQQEMEKETNMALFMIDVDRFKEVNDQFGHIFGDEVLKSIAETINNCFRKTDYVGRFGGDEFCVLMCGKFDRNILQSSAKLLLKRISELTFSKDYQATISIGIAQWDQQSSIIELAEQADKLLYQAKEKRNAYEISE